MTVDPARYGYQNTPDPAVHELTPIRLEGAVVEVRLMIRRGEDGTWRGRLAFGSAAEPEEAPATAEIFCAETEDELWQAVRDLREHHFRDLYRSISE